jgi:hypothetical protein
MNVYKFSTLKSHDGQDKESYGSNSIARRKSVSFFEDVLVRRVPQDAAETSVVSETTPLSSPLGSRQSVSFLYKNETDSANQS